MDDDDAVRLLGSAHGHGLLALARGEDDRPVEPYREAKSVSAEETFETDLRDPQRMAAEVDLLAAKVAGRLRKEGLAGRTVTLKVRFADFTARTRSYTHPQAVDGTAAVTRTARRLLSEIDTLTWSTAGGIRLLGVGVSGLADWFQPDLIAAADDAAHGRRRRAPLPTSTSPPLAPPPRSEPDPEPPPAWRPGADVQHADLGPGWVWGSGRGRVTVRFEGPGTAPGPVRTFAADDPGLSPADPPRP